VQQNTMEQLVIFIPSMIPRSTVHCCPATLLSRIHQGPRQPHTGHGVDSAQ
jgi:hypothetical protein